MYIHISIFAFVILCQKRNNRTYQTSKSFLAFHAYINTYQATENQSSGLKHILWTETCPMFDFWILVLMSLSGNAEPFMYYVSSGSCLILMEFLCLFGLLYCSSVFTELQFLLRIDHVFLCFEFQECFLSLSHLPHLCACCLSVTSLELVVFYSCFIFKVSFLLFLMMVFLPYLWFFALP